MEFSTLVILAMLWVMLAMFYAIADSYIPFKKVLIGMYMGPYTIVILIPLFFYMDIRNRWLDWRQGTTTIPVVPDVDEEDNQIP